ncbi:hypothetical protein [Streptomyces avermitilis]|uniref:hypothetical protein n=1 Tax=Streptomyces avermitilis TaxID=33903 RepID=UPI00371F38CD
MPLDHGTRRRGTERQIIRNGPSTQKKALPAGLVKDFSGLPGFLEVSVKNAAGAVVSKSKGTFCGSSTWGFSMERATRFELAL